MQCTREYINPIEEFEYNTFKDGNPDFNDKNCLRYNAELDDGTTKVRYHCFRLVKCYRSLRDYYNQNTDLGYLETSDKTYNIIMIEQGFKTGSPEVI